MDFQDRLKKAIERGEQRGDERARAEVERALTEDELKRLHSQFRLTLSEQIEKRVAQLPKHFPGFRIESLYGERGWGAAASRDDLGIDSGRRVEYFSRLEMTVRPFSQLHVLDLAAKGTVRNKEVFNRTYFQRLAEVDLEEFVSRIDNWTLEYAELYASKSKS